MDNKKLEKKFIELHERARKYKKHAELLIETIAKNKVEIEQQSTLLMDFKISEDHEGQERTQKKLKNLFAKLQEDEFLLIAYQKKNKGSLLTEKDIRVVKDELKNEKIKSEKKFVELNEEISDIEQQIRNLKKKEEQLTSQINQTYLRPNSDVEYDTLKEILIYIDPNIVERNIHEKLDFVHKWVREG